jgi:hypothetical protein
MSPHDQFELELREMRPRGASAKLKRRIADRLDERARVLTHRSWGVALASGLAAACLAAIALWRNDHPREKTGENVPRPLAVSPTQDIGLGPTVLAYRHALVRSPQHFDDLLDKHSMVTLPHNPARNGIRAFIRPDAKHPSWTGEL